jgi:hypothetical protein
MLQVLETLHLMCICYCERPKSGKCRDTPVNVNILEVVWRMSEILVKYHYF